MNRRVDAVHLSVCLLLLFAAACSTDPSKQVEAPVFDPASGAYAEAQSVTISCETDGAEIYYTRDGTEPDRESTLYESAVAVDTTATLMARAYKNGMEKSDIVTAVYAITDVATPTFDPVAGTYTTVQNVAIACTTPEAVIRFTTDGSDPTEASTAYSTPVEIDTTTTLKARAFRTGMTPSGVAEALYTIDFPDVAAPDFAPAPTTYTADQQVTLSCATADAAIYYTTDGSEPTEASTLYSSAFTLGSGTTTVRARAFKEFMDPSPIAEGTYVIDYPDVATPTLDPTPGTYSSDQLVTITCSTAGADIYYTTDNSEPTFASTLYTSAFTVSNPTMVKARGYKAAMDSSAVVEGYYYIDYPNVAQPVASPEGGIFSAGVTVSVTCATPGATIYYTTNGATPTESDAVWSGDQFFGVTTTLKVKAFATAMDPSGTVTEEYSIIPNLVAFYPFDGDASDASGNGHDGVLHGNPTLITLITGDGLYEFDGVDDYIELSDESAFDLTSFTFSFRMKVQEMPMSEGNVPINPGEWVLFSKGPTYGNYRLNYEHFGGASYGVLIYHHTDAGGYYASGHQYSPTEISPSVSWRHVVVTFDGTLKIYINGVLKLTDTGVSPPLTNNDNVLIGTASDAEANDFFKGQMNNFRVYSRALTTAEVLALYNNGG